MRNWATLLLLGTQLYELIQKAERAFGSGTGAQKYQQVLRDFGLFLETLAKSGQLSVKLSARILSNTPVVVEAMVAILNVFDAWQASEATEQKPMAEPQASNPPAQQPSSPPQSIYRRAMTEQEYTDLPTSAFSNGDRVGHQPWGDGSTRVYIIAAGDRDLPPSGWKEIRKVQK